MKETKKPHLLKIAQLVKNLSVNLILILRFDFFFSNLLACFYQTVKHDLPKMQHRKNIIKTRCHGTEEMVYPLPEDPGSTPSTHMVAHNSCL